jgi:hypothetical protein
VNVVIIKSATKEVIARYEVHLARDNYIPPDEKYFDNAWERAVADRLVDAQQRSDYQFQLQRPMNLYESSDNKPS